MEKFVNEYEYLIHLIKCAIHNRQPEEKPKTLSFEKVLEYGKIHEVANIAFVSVQKLKIKPKESIYKAWKTYYVFSIQRHANQMKARDRIVFALNEAGIRNVEMQGSVIKTLYPEPFWRMMSDIDFIINKENLEKAEIIMKKLGYQTKKVSDFEIDAFGPNKIAVELHTDFFPPTSTYYNAIPNVFEKSVLTGNGLTYKADTTVFYLYNLLHCMKHYLQKGAGIRRVLDMYILHQNITHINFTYVNDVLLQYNLKKDVEEIMELAMVWFGNATSKNDLSEIMQRVYLSGNHGTVQMHLNNEYRQKRIANKILFKCYKVITLLFPRKEIIYAGYPICQKYHFPIILGWLYRGGYIVFHGEKRKNALKLLKEIRKTKLV